MIISSALDYREAARRRLPRFLFDYIDGGAGTETTLAANVEDVGPLALDLKAAGDGGLAVKELPTLGEGIRRDIQNSHQEGLVTQKEIATS